jgi:hypothetical protein
VAELVTGGLINWQIAVKTDLSIHAVATHLDKIRDELGLRSRMQIALWATARTEGGYTARPRAAETGQAAPKEGQTTSVFPPSSSPHTGI